MLLSLLQLLLTNATHTLYWSPGCASGTGTVKELSDPETMVWGTQASSPTLVNP